MPTLTTSSSLASLRFSEDRERRDLRHLRAPFAVIGDVHGCWYTLQNLLDRLGPGADDLLVSVGDLHDKGGQLHTTADGPEAAGSVRVLRWALESSAAGSLVVVDSNHGVALARRLTPGSLPAKPSVEASAVELHAQPDADALVHAVRNFLHSRPSFVRLQGGPTGELVVAHAGVAERLFDARSLTVEEQRFSILAREFRWSGRATAIVGHMRSAEPLRIAARQADGGALLRIDTGCGEPGGKLTAYLPNRDSFVSVAVDPRDLRPHQHDC